jgi:acyl-CoA thioester hydrolase
MMAEHRKVFTVRRVEADYLSSAKFDDILSIETKIEKLTSARVVVSQVIFVKGTLIFKAIVTIACVNLCKGVSRIPVNIFQLMS